MSLIELRCVLLVIRICNYLLILIYSIVNTVNNVIISCRTHLSKFYPVKLLYYNIAQVTESHAQPEVVLCTNPCIVGI